MLLVFYRTCTDSNVGEQVVNVTPVFRIKHFVGRGQTTFFNGTDVQLTHCNQSGNHIRSFLRVRLGSNTFIAFAGCSWLIGVDTRDNNQTVFDIFCNFGQAADVVADRFFAVSGTRSDDN